MTFTYSGAPVAGTTDEIRFLLQDTDSTDPLFQNEEIQYYIDRIAAVNGSVLKTAAYLAETAAARFARQVSISSDQTSIAMEQLQQKYEDLASRLRAQAVELDASGGGPITGGVDDCSYDDWYYGGKPKVFGKKMHDNRLAGVQDNLNTDEWLDYEYGGFWDYE